MRIAAAHKSIGPNRPLYRKQRKLDALNTSSHQHFDSRRMERLWSLAVATSGNRRQIAEFEIFLDKPKPLPWVATGCREERMVRRGRRFEFRQRALQERRKPALFLSRGLARSPACGGYGALYGAFRFRTRAGKRRKVTHSPERLSDGAEPT
jgi:hypothetical protein